MAKTNSNPLAAMFERSVGVVRNRIIGRSYGEVGSGKTHFWLGAPGPIVVQSLDQGLEGVAIDQYEHKDIYPIEYDWSPVVKARGAEGIDAEEREQLQDQAIELSNQLCKDFEYACKHARTVIWDKEGDVWELFRYAEFGEPNDAPRNYPKLNQRYRKYINLPKSYDINFGLIQGMKNEWATVSKRKSSGEVVQSGAATGGRIAAGFGDLDGLVHINLHHSRREGKFYLAIGKARGPGAQDLQDKEFGPITKNTIGMSFAEFGELAFPDSTSDDWK